jgi:hypothetical protein
VSKPCGLDVVASNRIVAAVGEPRLDQVLDDFLLAVHDDRAAAGQRGEVDPSPRSPKRISMP